MKPLRILAIVVVLAFVLLLVVGFGNVLELLRSRVALFLALVPLLALFGWSIYKALQSRQAARKDYLDVEIPPPEN